MMVPTTAAHTASRTPLRVNEIVARQGQEAARVRLVRRLASALLRLLHISPEEDTLTAWLDDKDCHCKAEAVRVWVEVQLEDAELACSTSNPQLLVGALAHRLQHRLFAIEDALA